MTKLATVKIKARTDFYLHRVPEEFYDLTTDPSERRNHIADPARQNKIETLRAELLARMRCTGDPFAEALADRENKSLVPALLKKLKTEYRQAAKQKQDAE